MKTPGELTGGTGCFFLAPFEHINLLDQDVKSHIQNYLLYPFSRLFRSSPRRARNIFYIKYLFSL
jgi:hypothetical protein